MVNPLFEQFDDLIQRKLKYRNAYAARQDHNPNTLKFYDTEIDELEKFYNYMIIVRDKSRKIIDENLHLAFYAGHQNQILKENTGTSHSVFFYVAPKYV